MKRGHRAALGLAAAALGLTSAPGGAVQADVSLNFSASASGTVDRDSTSTSGSGDAEGYVSVGEYVAQGLAEGFAEGERRLELIQRSVWTEPVCGGQPLVMLKSDAEPPNGGCLPEQTQFNLSCTCLSGFDNASSWDLRLKAPTAADTSNASIPVTQDGSEGVAVSSLMTIDLPNGVEKL